MILILLTVSIVIPLIYIIHVSRLSRPSKLSWLISLAESAAIIALIFLVARWDIADIYTRTVLSYLFAAAILWSMYRHVSQPWWSKIDPLRNYWKSLASLLSLSAGLLFVASGLLPPSNTHPLALPLTDARFVSAQAGTNSLLNYHSRNAEQQFAVDFTAINSAGIRATWLLPDNFKDYVIFGVAVVSPCTGTVVGMRGDLPDLVPPERDRENPRGNHVTLLCNDLRIELAHLRQGSVLVDAGDHVMVGAALGQVGNSGNTTEPHLHIHAYDPATGIGVPISFGGRFPVRNKIFM